MTIRLSTLNNGFQGISAPHKCRACGIPRPHVELRGRISRNPGSQPFCDFTAERNPDRTPRSLSAGGQFTLARACANVLDTRGRFLGARAPPFRVPERCSWQPLKPGKEAKHKESRGAPGNQFPLLRMPASTPLVISGLQQVHVALVPQALKFQGPSLGLWLADFRRELMKFQDWRPPILSFWGWARELA